jgi:hypothetical protein
MTASPSDIAAVIGVHLAVRVASISREEADAHFGFLGASVSTDNPTSSTLTRALLGWNPIHPRLIPDLEEGDYFAHEPA